MAAIARVRRYPFMLAFLDFEASSLGKRSYPIEVAWVFEDGRSEAHLIRPAPDWVDWDPAAEAIHHIDHSQLVAHGTPHEAVAQRMVDALAGHDLLASAPSWDGKWLSALLRAAGFARHTLRLRDSDDALRESAIAILCPVAPANCLDEVVSQILASSEARGRGQQPVHRALADAQDEHALWLRVCEIAQSIAARRR